MSKDFRIYQDGDRQIIERLTYPRFKGVVTFNSPLSDIEELCAISTRICHNTQQINNLKLRKNEKLETDFIINFSVNIYRCMR